ncbi:MAG: DNA recombination protein RmuC [Buchananella hordeovulneris]|nr:DNA recombination protein RmuC [Buchananella hordeovulneris]
MEFWEVAVMLFLALVSAGAGWALGRAQGKAAATGAEQQAILQAQEVAAAARAEAARALGELESERARANGVIAAERQRAEGLVQAEKARASTLEQQLRAQKDRASRDTEVLRQLTPVREVLDSLASKVEASEKERSSQFAALSTQLTTAARTDAELLSATRSLDGVLRASRSRGVWGETTLRRVIEASGMLRHVDFEEQTAIPGSSQRPDVTVHLPGGAHLAIDAKVPLDAYLENQDAGTGAPVDLKAHAAAVRSHVSALAKRDYPAALGDGPQATILFLPAEQLLSGALEADSTLLSKALESGIILATPATLLAVLKAVAAVWSQEAAREDAERLLAVGRRLYDRLGIVAGHLTALGKDLQKTVTDYNRVVGSFETRLLVTAREVSTLSSKELALPEFPADAGQVRDFTAGELTTQ